MKLQNPTSQDFKIHTILYNKEGFTIAYGKWADGPSRLAMKWHIESSDIPNNEMAQKWFHLPTDKKLTEEFLKGILEMRSLLSDSETRNEFFNK